MLSFAYILLANPNCIQQTMNCSLKWLGQSMNMKMGRVTPIWFLKIRELMKSEYFTIFYVNWPRFENLKHILCKMKFNLCVNLIYPCVIDKNARNYIVPLAVPVFEPDDVSSAIFKRLLICSKQGFQWLLLSNQQAQRPDIWPVTCCDVA